MAVTDDVPDDVMPTSPVSPTQFSHSFTLPAVEQCAPNVSEVSLHQHHHKSVDDERQAAVKSSLLCAGDYSFTHPHRATYQTDSFLPVESGVVSSHSNNTAICISSQADNSGPTYAASSGAGCGRDAFMDSEPVLRALDMGFDYETVRTVVHLRMVQSGENYTSATDLVEAVLAYNAAMDDVVNDIDDDVDDENIHCDRQQQQQHQQPQQQQQRRQVKPAATTTSGLSLQRDHDVGFDVTDGGFTPTAAAAATAATTKPPGKRKKRRTNKSAGSRATVNQSQTDAEVVDQFTKLRTSSSDAGSGCRERLPWDIEVENKRLKAAKTCKICLEADIGVVFVPCGHLVCCTGCASLVSRCSLCQCSVRDSVRIYMN